ncbi:MAG: hypothetical protein IGR92_00705 [Leptolyngbyaceae cyanobacterium T60_A2020_046]|nr:hypothetical protein [Leptolyngbyaceae cyanobacterium T60_A2020_046]
MGIGIEADISDLKRDLGGSSDRPPPTPTLIGGIAAGAEFLLMVIDFGNRG